jgi:hypothetical protein
LNIDVTLSMMDEFNQRKRLPLVTCPHHEWWVVRCKSKNGHIKKMSLKVVGVRAQNVLHHYRLKLQHGWGGGLYVAFTRLIVSGL